MVGCKQTRLNIAKTEFILIGSKPMLKKTSQANVHIENKQIKQVCKYETLGVTIDQHLSWKGNTKNICKLGIHGQCKVSDYTSGQINLFNTKLRKNC